MSIMDAVPLAEDPNEKLKTCLFTQAISASPVALAVLGWITDMTVTEPRIEELHATSDGFIMVRHSDEVVAEVFGSLPDFLGQVRQLCEEVGLTAGQAEKVTAAVRKRLG